MSNAVRLLATGGQARDSPQALALLDGLNPGKVLADTAYDSDETRAYCAQHHIEAVIPNHPNRLEPAEVDEQTYRDRDKIERFFGRLIRKTLLSGVASSSATVTAPFGATM